MGVGLLVAMASAYANAVLIVQGSIAGSDNPDENFNLSQVMAGRLDEDGRLRPIVWSVTDPIFRVAMEDRVIRPSENPTPAEIQDVASKLRCDYVMEITFWKRDQEIFARARLLRKGKEVWKDPSDGSAPNIPAPAGARPLNEQEKNARRMEVAVNGATSMSDVINSLAGTWRDMLNAGPLKTVADRPRQDTPQPDQGQANKVEPPKPPPKVDNSALMADVMKKLATGDRAGAVALLRDAIDAEPLDRDRRRALYDTLISAGLTLDAAQQARRAAQILPNGAEFWALAARAWLIVGKETEAQQDLNEAVARDPENQETRLLLGEIALLKSDLPDAKRHLDAAIEKGLTTDGLLLRGFYGAMTGGDSATADFQRAKELGAFDGDRLEKTYNLAVRLSRATLGDAGEAARNLMTMARRDRQEAGIEPARATLRERVTRALAILDPIPVPKKHEASDGDRRLALKLLSQFLSELDAFLKSGDEDAAGDAAITLGEALRRWREGEARFANEVTEGPSEAAGTVFFSFCERDERDWIGISLDEGQTPSSSATA
jgi:tetratricopeptide (TPR) repeat protein